MKQLLCVYLRALRNLILRKEGQGTWSSMPLLLL